jgi:SAM-dependent methyltransferase
MLDSIHENFTYDRRVQVLSRHIASLIDPNASILDIGCGDGQISELISAGVEGSKIEGIDVMERSISSIKVSKYDGFNFPFDDNSFDTCVFVDVLHHADDAPRVLAEAGRVARKSIVIKDHLTDGFLNEPILKFMDYVGNKRHGVALPYHYYSKPEWTAIFDNLNWKVDSWNTNLKIYPWWCTWAFDRELHFIAKIDVNK